MLLELFKLLLMRIGTQPSRALAALNYLRGSEFSFQKQHGRS